MYAIMDTVIIDEGVFVNVRPFKMEYNKEKERSE